VGYQALEANTTAANNTALGYDTGRLTTGAGNTFVGANAGTWSVPTTSGTVNTIIGAYCRSTSGTTSGAMMLGYDLSGEAGYTTLGQSGNDIRAQHGVATWATVSDERYKKDIADSTAGLSFINALQPRTFKYKTLGELPETFNAYEEGSTEVAYQSHPRTFNTTRCRTCSHHNTRRIKKWKIKSQQNKSHSTTAPLWTL
jgi:hypothetical protein